MTERQAALTSMHEYIVRLKGKEKEEQRRYELARWAVWKMMAPHFKRGAAPKTAQDYCTFPWEKTSKVAVIPTNEEEAQAALERCRVSPEEAEALNRLFEKINQKAQN